MDEQLQSQLLSQLKDVHIPDAVSWWPLAIGWWILAIIVLVSSITLIRFFIRRKKQNHYRKLALKELDTHYRSWQSHHNDKAYIAAANNVLKRVSRIVKPDYVSQFSDAWIDSLESHNQTNFSQEARYALAHQCYQEHVNADIELLNKEVSQWLKGHTHEVRNA